MNTASSIGLHGNLTQVCINLAVDALDATLVPHFMTVFGLFHSKVNQYTRFSALCGPLYTVFRAKVDHFFSDNENLIENQKRNQQAIEKRPIASKTLKNYSS